MQQAPIRTVFDEVTDFLASDPTPEQIIAYQLPNNLQARVHELLEKNGEGELSEQERGELTDYARIENMMGLLKVKTKIKLTKADH